MNSIYKERVGMVVMVRVAMVALVLLCIAPHKLEAEVPALVEGDGALSSAALSAEDWSAIQANLAQAADYAPLVVGQVAKLTASDASAGDEFGYVVAVSGDTIVVGAPDDDDGGDLSGSAYVFERNQGGADNWGEVQKLTASDAAASDEFGYAVSISGDTVVAGAHGDGSSTSGSAYIFERNHDPNNPGTPLADNWGQVQKLAASDATGLADLCPSAGTPPSPGRLGRMVGRAIRSTTPGRPMCSPAGGRCGRSSKSPLPAMGRQAISWAAPWPSTAIS